MKSKKLTSQVKSNIINQYYDDSSHILDMELEKEEVKLGNKIILSYMPNDVLESMELIKEYFDLYTRHEDRITIRIEENRYVKYLKSDMKVPAKFKTIFNLESNQKLKKA